MQIGQGSLSRAEGERQLAKLDARRGSAARAKWQPVVQTARELMQKTLAPVRWTVDELITEGVTLLAAKPKKGKSVLMLNISGSVAEGTNALGSPTTTQGDVLYLALESNEARMQGLLKTIYGPDGEPPDRLHLVYTWPRLHAGGLEALDDWMHAQPHTRLVVIDTLEHVWAPRTPGGSVYADDYNAVRPLQELAGRHRVAVVAIHHTKKGIAEDPLDEVSGSTGLTAGVDNILVMRAVGGVMELVTAPHG